MAILTKIINSSITKVYTNGGGNFLTQAGDWANRQFYTSRLLAPGESAEQWTEWTAAQKAAYDADPYQRPPQEFIDDWCSVYDGSFDEARGLFRRGSTWFTYAEALKRRTFEHEYATFIAQWNTACISWSYGYNKNIHGKYNPETGLFELNGLPDIGLEEALAIYEYRWPIIVDRINTNNVKVVPNYPIRTLFPLTSAAEGSKEVQYLNIFFSNLFFKAYNAPCVLAVDGGSNKNGFVVRNMNSAFYGGRGLEKILGKIDVSMCTDFGNCFYLASPIEFDFYGLTVSLDIKGLSRISITTVQLLVSQALNTSPITITVHADVFAKLTDPSNSEWYQVMLDAQARQITFASA